MLLAALACALAWSWAAGVTARLEGPVYDRWFRFGGLPSAGHVAGGDYMSGKALTGPPTRGSVTGA